MCPRQRAGQAGQAGPLRRHRPLGCAATWRQESSLGSVSAPCRGGSASRRQLQLAFRGSRYPVLAHCVHRNVDVPASWTSETTCRSGVRDVASVVPLASQWRLEVSTLACGSDGRRNLPSRRADRPWFKPTKRLHRAQLFLEASLQLSVFRLNRSPLYLL